MRRLFSQLWQDIRPECGMSGLRLDSFSPEYRLHDTIAPFAGSTKETI